MLLVVFVGIALSLYIVFAGVLNGIQVFWVLSLLCYGGSIQIVLFLLFLVKLIVFS